MKEIIPIKDNVDLVKLGARNLYLVGTAHISKASADLAEEIIRDIKPDSVAVELCESRYQSLKDPDRWRNTDIISVIKTGKTYVLMAQLILAAFQKKLGDKLEVKPGAEMMRAMSVAEEENLQTVLADRDVRTTLKRTWSSLGLFSMTKLLTAMLGSLFVKHDINEEDIERLKSADALEEMMSELSAIIPGVRTALIDERDKYLAEKIQSSPGDKVVAIVGAGHIPGIKNYIGNKIELEPLEEVPKPRKIGKIIAWAIPILIIGMITYGFFTAGASSSFEMVKVWVFVNSFFACLGALIALAHPLTILAAVLAAPITSINPFVAAGWVAGLVEALIRKPRVSDFETIADDLSTVKGIWTNRLSKILLVVALTNLGSVIGTFIGIPMVASLLSEASK